MTHRKNKPVPTWLRAANLAKITIITPLNIAGCWRVGIWF
jgi:hypothetical protein